MRTAIGERLTSSPGRLVTASAIAVLIVSADVALAVWNRYPGKPLREGASWGCWR